MLSTIGMQEFDAQVQRGTVHELSEDGFVARVTAAGGMLLDDYLRKVDELKLRYYG